MTLIRRSGALISAAAVLAAGCSHTVTGTAHPGAHLGTAPVTTSPTTTPAPPPVTPADLSRILLGRDAIAVLTDAPDIAQTGQDWTAVNNLGAFIDDPSCGSIPGSTESTLYANSGYISIRGNRFETPVGGPLQGKADVTQAAASFLTSVDARAFLDRTEDVWRSCANRSFAFDFSDGVHGHLEVGSPVKDPDRVAIPLNQQDDPAWRCSHVMAVRNTVAVESRICMHRGDPAAAADDAVNQMLADR